MQSKLWRLMVFVGTMAMFVLAASAPRGIGT